MLEFSINEATMTEVCLLNQASNNIDKPTCEIKHVDKRQDVPSRLIVKLFICTIAVQLFLSASARHEICH